MYQESRLFFCPALAEAGVVFSPKPFLLHWTVEKHMAGGFSCVTYRLDCPF